MKRRYKLKHQILKEFTQLLYEYNPMELQLKGNPRRADEYESEALSILCRFNEAAIHLCDDPIVQRECAAGIIVQAFRFWFNEEIKIDPYCVGVLLLGAYNLAYRAPEQATAPEVGSDR